MAFWVFLHHAERMSYGSALRAPVINVVATTGYLGVGFFFVLSGFILTINGADMLSRHSYAVRRAARIYPLYLLIIAAGVAADLAAGEQVRPIAVVAAILLVQAWFDQADIYFVGVFAAWSLSVELLLYTIFPAAGTWLRRLATRRLAAVAGILVLVTFATGAAIGALGADAEYWAYIFPPSRIAEFLLGIVAAQLYLRGHRLPRAAAALCLVMVLLAGVAPQLPEWLIRSALLAPLWPLLVVALASSHGAVSRRLASRTMVLLGEASYAFYLVHGLVLVLAFELLQRLGVAVASPSNVVSIIVVVITFAAAIVGSIVLLRTVERPLLWRIRRRFDPAALPA
jgi:peptidoglycan/LPS O-acetylase OafA/YrhL